MKSKDGTVGASLRTLIALRLFVLGGLSCMDLIKSSLIDGINPIEDKVKCNQRLEGPRDKSRVGIGQELELSSLDIIWL
jgi:hypothetical protein